MMKNFTHKSFYPWLVMLLCAAFLFYKYILQVFPGIITENLMSEFHINGAGLGNLAACYFYAYFITQLLVGVLLDRFSVRKFSAFAILISGIGAIWFAKTFNLFGAGLGRALMGMGTAFATVCYLKCTAMWFKPNRFAFVSGLLATAAMLGAVFGEAPVAMLVQAFGWHQTFFVIGLIGALLAVLFYTFVADRPKDELSINTQFGVSWSAILSVFRTRQNWLLTLYSGLVFTPISVFGGLWGVPFLKTAFMLSTTDAASLVSAAFLGLAAGGPLLGLLSDYLDNRKNVMFAGTLVSLLALIVIVYVPYLNYIPLAILLFIFGFGIGSFMLCFALGKELNSLAVTATVIALINSGDAIFGSFTEPLIGHFLDLHATGVDANGVLIFTAQDYRSALSLLVIYMVVACLSVFLMRDPKKS